MYREMDFRSTEVSGSVAQSGRCACLKNRMSLVQIQPDPLLGNNVAAAYKALNFIAEVQILLP